jgi:hypothetical protein
MILLEADHVPMTSTASITIRRATVSDDADLERLARLDSQRPVAGPHLLALVDDEAVAAVSLPAGRVFADPFAASADVVALLRERADAIRGAGARRPGVPALALMRGLFPATR